MAVLTPTSVAKVTNTYHAIALEDLAHNDYVILVGSFCRKISSVDKDRGKKVCASMGEYRLGECAELSGEDTIWEIQEDLWKNQTKYRLDTDIAEEWSIQIHQAE